METVDNTLDCSIDDVLDRPLFCFLAMTTDGGQPRLSPLWYLWEDEQVWIIGDTVEKSYVDRIRANPRTALAIVDFDPTTGRVHHVGMRGTTTLEPYDHDRGRRLFARYLGEDESAWDPAFVDLDDDRWGFLRFDPETVVARDQSFAPSLDRGT